MNSNKIYTQNEVATELNNIIDKNDDVLIHLSFKSLGKLEHDFDTLFNALKTIDATIMLPTLSYKTVTKQNPIFSVKETPSCVGAFTNYLLKQSGVARSINPTHSVCGFGSNVYNYLNGHIQDNTPCGKNSPFKKLCDNEGKIILIGCGLEPNTTMHAIEELVNPPYLFEKDKVLFTLINDKNSSQHKEYYVHNFLNTEQHYERIENIMPLKKVEFLNTYAYVINAGELLDKALKKYKENKLYFVESTL